MPFVLIIAGTVLLVSSVRGTTDTLFTLVKGDFTGQNNFTYWLVSILIIGELGTIESLRPLSRIFLALVIIVLFVSHGDVFAQFNKEVFTTTPSNNVTNVPINLNGLPGNFTGNLNDLLNMTDQYGMPVPLVSPRPSNQ